MEATSKADHWISATIQTLKKSSPTSLKIFLRLVCVQNALKVLFYVHSKVHFSSICSTVEVYMCVCVYIYKSSREREDSYKDLRG